jgi:drug/metabolite transporter (DMT)-like permease
VALGAIVLDEAITWQIVVGASVILLSVALVVRRESPREIAAEGESLAGAAAPPAAADRSTA